jgi:hypothetical protein
MSGLHAYDKQRTISLRLHISWRLEGRPPLPGSGSLTPEPARCAALAEIVARGCRIEEREPNAAAGRAAHRDWLQRANGGVSPGLMSGPLSWMWAIRQS